MAARVNGSLGRRFPAGLGGPTLAGVAILVLWLAAGLTVGLLSPYDPLQIVGRRLEPPSSAHWLGTDALGRDVLVRTVYGLRHSLPVALVVVAVGVAIGSVLGAVAGYAGRIADNVIMRMVDITLSFPPVLLAMAVAASLGPSLENAAIAMVVVTWPVYARLMRAQVLAVREREHVEAAVAAGARHARILFRHILPLCWSPILISATMDIGQVILLTASLSFIGLGATPPTPEWGQMIAEGAVNFYQWWVALGPGLAILSVVLAFNFLGDGIRDLLDPRSK